MTYCMRPPQCADVDFVVGEIGSVSRLKGIAGIISWKLGQWIIYRTARIRWQYLCITVSTSSRIKTELGALRIWGTWKAEPAALAVWRLIGQLIWTILISMLRPFKSPSERPETFGCTFKEPRKVVPKWKISVQFSVCMSVWLVVDGGTGYAMPGTNTSALLWLR